MDEPRGRSPWRAVVAVALMVAVAAVGLTFATGRFSSDGASDSGRRESAFVACSDGVRARLKAPGSAVFPDWPDVGSIRKGAAEGSLTVRSFVDADNSFGARLRLGWVCQVVPAGEEWRVRYLRVDE